MLSFESCTKEELAEVIEILAHRILSTQQDFVYDEDVYELLHSEGLEIHIYD